MRVTFAIRSYAMYNIIHKNTQRVGLERLTPTQKLTDIVTLNLSGLGMRTHLTEIETAVQTQETQKRLL